MNRPMMVLEPSTSDFKTFELLEIVEKFAIGFDDLPALTPGRDDMRCWTGCCQIVI